MPNTHTIIISDIHLRSEHCQAKLLFDTLAKYEYETLIIAGDLIEEDKAHYENVKMNWHQFKFIQYLRERLEKDTADKKIIRISGNHDSSGADFINQLLGIETIQDHQWEIAGKKFGVIHGHQFDKFIFKYPTSTRFAVKAYLFFQKIDTDKKHLTKIIDNFHSKWSRLAEAVALGAKEFALQKNIDVIICGHTHEPTRHTFNENGRTIEYLNSGGWTGHQCSFITISKDGVTDIHKLDPTS